MGSASSCLGKDIHILVRKPNTMGSNDTVIQYPVLCKYLYRAHAVAFYAFVVFVFSLGDMDLYDQVILLCERCNLFPHIGPRCVFAVY